MTSLPNEKEGVIKYQLKFHRQALFDHHLTETLFTIQQLSALLHDINASRTVLKDKGLIGQDPDRYGGDGFGNISVRMNDCRFMISGSQTGNLDLLSMCDVAVVDEFNVELNQLIAHGLSKPSSESMTHGVCFQAFKAIGAVVHIHSPDIWHTIDDLNLPFTEQSIPYGTPQMADAVSNLLLAHFHTDSPLIFGMKGHEDGVVAVADTLKTCTSSLLECLNNAILLKSGS